MKTRVIILSILAFLYSVNTWAGIEIFSNRKAGSTNLVTSSSVPLFSVYDGKYYDMQTNPSWSTDYTNASVKNTVRFGINPAVPQTTDMAGTVTLKIKMWKWVSGSFVSSSTTQTLSVNYDYTTSTNLVDEIQSYSFSDAHRVEVYLISASGATLNLDDVYISSEMEIDRKYTLTSGAVTGLSVVTTDSNYYEFNWDQKIGAETYELEWVHISDETATSGSYTSTSALTYDYYLNSTRVVTSGNTYRLPKVFDRGYIVYRVRAVGYFGTTGIRNEGAWTNVESGTIASHNAGHVITVNPSGGNFASKMNWGHQTTYDDKGLRFDAMVYADGLGRARQQLALNEATGQTVVSNVYYDELGRAVISDLPTPQAGENLHFIANFNLFATDNLPHGVSPGDFDDAASDTCNIVAAPFANTTGAGLYYSTANTTQDGPNVRVPDAGGFPYSRIYYMNDFTMRPEKVAAMGAILHGGNGHDTKIYYPTANQAELDKLFGAEVGKASHYKKMVTVDANGQIYVQYSDMAGRVVASYMAGNNPNTLDAISGNGAVTSTTDILPENEQLIDTDIPSATLTYMEFVESAGEYTFTYSFTPESFHNECMTEDFCLDCAYDYKFLVIEECSGHILYADSTTMLGEDEGNTCNEDSQETFVSDPVYLAVGNYQIVKQLKLHEEIIDDNWCAYIDQSTCLTPISELFTPVYDVTVFENCDKEPEELSDNPVTCDDYRQQMLQDLMPGGQYALFDNNDGVYTALTAGSTVHSVLTVGSLGVHMDWKHPATPYVNNDGSIPSPDPASYASIQDFVANFQDKWAESLLPYHPEYCFLQQCDSNSASNDYDQDMLSEYEFSNACAAGYLEPLSTSDASPLPCSTSITDPYFVMHPTLASTMDGEMNNYLGTGHSIWEEAIYAAIGEPGESFEDCINRYTEHREEYTCSLDLIWVTYRRMYLELKTSMIYDETHEYCSNDFIGTGDWSENHAIWGNYTMLAGVDTDNSGVVSSTEAQDYLDDLTAQGCQSACEQYAQDWMEQLSGCEQFASLSAMDSTNMFNDFVDLCMTGCDAAHPQGSSTAPPTYTGTFHNIDDILIYYFGTSYEDEWCTSLLISEPAPYDSTDHELSEVTHPLDVCACTAIEQANYDVANNNPNSYNLEQMLAYNTGISVEDADYLLCTCDKYLNGLSYDPENTDMWIKDADDYMAETGILVPASLSCGNTSCVNCETVNGFIADLNTRFEEVENFTQTANYPEILTNYLNQLLGFHLTYPEYASYIGKCNASSETPYCELNPLMNEWSEVMTLLSFRGELVYPSSWLDLTLHNIVYASGKLKDFFNGNQYNSSVDGNNLGMFFGTESQSCKINLFLPEGADFTYTDIVRFGTVHPSSTACTNNDEFTVDVEYLKCGELHTAQLSGESDCITINVCYCGPTEEQLCDHLPEALESECYQPLLDQMYQNALETYYDEVAEEHKAYISEYKSQCAAAFSTEALSFTSPKNNYQYTLFFYDQAGNLVRTVAPEGIPASFSTANVATARGSVVDFSTYTAVGTFSPSPFPANTFETQYAYNSYNQPVSTTNPDQNGATKYWYDRYGRIVASQNPIQYDEQKFTYMLYDKFGRPVETGQMDRVIPPGHDGSPGITISDISETTIKADDLDAGFKTWVYGGIRTEVTFTVYDTAMSPVILNDEFKDGQQNLRLRVASVVYFASVSGSTMPLTGYESAIHYSYDLHGNVVEHLQDVPMLAPVHQDIKSTRYEFELISGNVKKVKYQEEEHNDDTGNWEPGRDRITHEYVYDKMNRLTEVFTTTDGGVHKSREAHYRYFDYGPMAREELGEHKVQANDYTYTINGWMKGMNSNTLVAAHDPGKDGAGGSNGYYANNAFAHDNVARDLVGYSIGYFQGDYSAIMSNSFEADPYAVTNSMASSLDPLYNGNISHIVTAISGFTNTAQASVYRYDQLNRLKTVKTYTDVNLTLGNNWSATTTYTDAYHSEYTYDKNGNLATLERKGNDSATLYAMDALIYHYTSGTNRLDYANDLDASVNGTYTSDINSGQSSGNYSYDKLGQLIGDVQEGITSIKWRYVDKKLKLQKDGNYQVEFIYNPMGQRVVKIVKQVVSGSVKAQDSDYSWAYTYYAYDANGQVMATYEVNMNDAASLEDALLSEQMLYGAGRLGINNADKILYSSGYANLEGPVFTNQLGWKNYELKNYLGNVNAVITDRKMVSQATQLYELNTFASGTDSWLTSSGTVTATGGQLVKSQTGSTIYVYKSYTTTVGEDYMVAITAANGTTSGLSAVIDGTTYALTTGVTNYFRFTATTTSSQIRIKPTSGSGSYTYYVQDVLIKQRTKYDAVEVMRTDYYPFGMAMPGRTWNNNYYRYGYNGMELDNEIKGNGNSYTTEFRQYDPRLGRWLSLDPLMGQFPWMSPYVAFDDNPILYDDPYGLSTANEGDPPTVAPTSEGQISEDGEWESYHDLGTGKFMWAEIGRNIAPVVINGQLDNSCEAIFKREVYAVLKSPTAWINELLPTTLGTANDLDNPFSRIRRARSNYYACLGIPEPPEDITFLNVVHGILDGLSLIPLAGDLADAVNAIVYAAEGDYIAAGASAGAIIIGSSGILVPIAKKTFGEVIEEVEEQGIRQIVQEGDDIIGKNVEKIDRSLLDPPKKSGGAPTFKSDGTPVEIHHVDQNPNGPFKEMHWKDHRGKGNHRKNHPNSDKKSGIDRKKFNRQKKKYWKNEYPSEK